MKRCYICFEDTKYQSECECNSYICKNCLEKEIEYRKGQCSICRSKIINKDFISLEIENDNIQNDNTQNNTWYSVLQYMILYSIFLSVYITIIFLGGNLVNIIILKKTSIIIFNLYTFVLGILFYILFLLCILISYGILALIYFLLFLLVRDIFK
tara:strand:- start:605 stop:1069 length:465 start_codon:yes stop_codon:yes gene_type:complete